ncbi:MAG: DNA internalization-related competence protein ComEC/Rec2 [Thermodesulfobacteriota bacterium]
MPLIGKISISFQITRPFVPLVLSLMAGLIGGDHIPDPASSILPWILGFLLPAFALGILLFRPLALWFACAFLVATGLCLMTFLSPRVTAAQVPPQLLNHRLQHLAGEIMEEPVSYQDQKRFVIRLTAYSDQGRDYPAQGMILLTVNHSNPNLTETNKQTSYPHLPSPLSSPTASSLWKGEDRGGGGNRRAFYQGDPVRFVCRLRLIEGYHNPGGYPFERRMARNGIRVSAFIETPELLILNGLNKKTRLFRSLSRLRNQVVIWIDSGVSFPAASLARAVLTGDQSQIPKSVQETFSRAGVSHLLAFSGLNLSLVGGLSFLLFRFLLSLSEKVLLFLNVRKWALVASFFPVLGYALLAGLSPPAVRAFLMVTLVILALIIQRYSDLLNSLALAALILLLFSPQVLFLPSFQLSFISVWAIGYLLPRIWDPFKTVERKKTNRWRRLLYYLWGTLSVSLVCQLATAPLVIWWFHQVSLIGLISNLILVPLTGLFITPIGLLALIFAPLSVWVSSLLFGIMDILLQWTLWWTQFFAELPFSYLTLPRPGFAEMGTYFLALALIFNSRRIPKPGWWISFAVAATLFFFFLPPIRDTLLRSMRIHFLDVGHGSSVLVEFPRGEKMLVDGGGSFNPEFDIGERVVAPFLWAKKINRLDVVVLTHPHPDHLNGLPFILSRFKVKEIWSNGQETDSGPFLRFKEEIRAKQIPVRYPGQKWSRFFADVRVEVLSGGSEKILRPEMSGMKEWHDQNNDSLVLRISRSGEHILLPADIEAAAEKQLIGRKDDLKSRVLQVPHHGSLTSSTTAFIEAVAPSWAVISGRASARFPVPHPKVIRRYEEKGVRVFRTDVEGLITITLNKGRWQVESYRRGSVIGAKKIVP